MAKKAIVKKAVAKAAPKRVMRRYAPDMKIRVIAKANPYREDGTRGKLFATIKNGMTIGAFVKGDKKRLRLVRRSTRAGFLAIA